MKGNLDMDSPDTPQKQCAGTCQQWLPATSEFFHKDKRKKDGLCNQCKECAIARSRAWKAVHKEERSESGKAYYRANKSEIGKKQKAYANGRIGVSRAYHHHYYLAHQEVAYERAKRYKKTDRGRMGNRAHLHRRRARERAAGGSYTVQQLQQQVERQKARCYYCKVKLGKVYHADHIVPLARGGTNDISNIVLACPTCNLRKGAKLPHEWDGSGGRLL
jgi:5-methylcytosine-specific restriction endonuclease McrA